MASVASEENAVYGLTKAALVQLSVEIKDTRGVLVLIFGSKEAQKQNELAISSDVASGAAANPHLDILRKRPAGEQAVTFWQEGGWQKEAPINELLDALTLVAMDNDMLPDGVGHLEEVDRVSSYFAGKGNAEIVAVTRFAVFLGKATTVADALRVLLAQPSSNATAPATRVHAQVAAPERPEGAAAGAAHPPRRTADSTPSRRRCSRRRRPHHTEARAVGSG
jgi:hypothetical protein